MARAVEAPQRRCLVTREVKGKEQMIRFVLDPAGGWCRTSMAGCPAAVCG